MEPLSTWELEGREEHKAFLWKNEFASCGTWEFEGKEECNALYGQTNLPIVPLGGLSWKNAMFVIVLFFMK